MSLAGLFQDASLEVEDLFLDDLSAVLDRVAAAGGQVVMPKTSIGENGFMAYFMDTEGNRVGLHSMG